MQIAILNCMVFSNASGNKGVGRLSKIALTKAVMKWLFHFQTCEKCLSLLMQVRSIMRKEMEKAGVKDPQILDKSYWIQRVGEVCREQARRN